MLSNDANSESTHQYEIASIIKDTVLDRKGCIKHKIFEFYLKIGEKTREDNKPSENYWQGVPLEKDYANIVCKREYNPETSIDEIIKVCK